MVQPVYPQLRICPITHRQRSERAAASASEQRPLHTFKQLLAMGVGGIAGIACFVGTTMLVHL